MSIILLMLSMAAPASVSAEDTPIYSATHYYIPGVRYFLESPTTIESTLESVLAKENDTWQLSSQNNLNLGYKDQVLWIKFKLAPGLLQDRNQLIEIAYPHLDNISFYQIRNSAIIQQQTTGDTLPFNQRPVEHAHFLFPIITEDSRNDTFVFRIQTSGTLQIPLKVWENEAFFIHSSKVEQIHAAYYGILLVIITFNFVIFAALRERTYLYYCLSTFGYLSLISTLRGKTFQLFWPNMPQVQDFVMLTSTPSALIFSALFATSFLSLKRTNNFLYKLLLIVAGLSGISLLASFFIPYHTSIQISVLLAIPGCLVLLIAGPTQWYRGQKAARLYSIAWALLAAGGTLAALNKAGILPINFITEYGMEIGSALEAMILSVALAERLYREREDKVKAQSATIKEHNERRIAELTIIRQALTHPVTKLPNYTHFEMCVNNWISENPDVPFAIVIIQLSNFHEINKTLGYGNADKLLVQIAHRLNAIAEQAPGVRILEKTESRNFYASSFEGATFGLAIELNVWRHRDEEIKRFLRNISSPTEFAGMIIELPPHTGTANYPENGEDASSLIRRAHVAMEYAHRFENHLAHYRSEQDPYNAKRLTLISELKRAIQEDLLELYLQPKINLQTMDVIGVEALLRWHHPSFGFVPPDEFVIVAEQTGIIKPLTRWVLRHALVHLKHLEKKGYKLNMSINISPNNLKESDFNVYVNSLLQEFRIAPEQITLELTETSMMADPLKALEALNQLHKTGVRLSIDDFGTGYSSLSYIKKVPAQEIKIDKSLIFELDKLTDDEVLVRTTVDMCHSLGFKVVAEGVESVEVSEKLVSMGCDLVQGYYFSKPLPITEFEKWIVNYRHDALSKNGSL